jgi:hypothetical protein
MRFRNKSGIWIGGFVLTLLLAAPTKADLCDRGEDTIVTHQIFHGDPATIIRCSPMYSVAPEPHPKVSRAPAVKPQKVASEPPRLPARNSRRHQRQKGVLDALSSIFSPHR